MKTLTFEQWEAKRNASIRVENEAPRLLAALKGLHRLTSTYPKKGDCRGMGTHDRRRGEGHDCLFCDAFHAIAAAEGK